MLQSTPGGHLQTPRGHKSTLIFISYAVKFTTLDAGFIAAGV